MTMLSVKTPAVQTATIRLNKAIAQAGICSRRAADRLIQDGLVRINGAVVNSPGIQIDPGKDQVLVKGRPLPSLSVQEAEHLYLAMYKPSGIVTTAKDPQGRQTVLDLLPVHLRRRRPVPVGRLDLLSEGLLLLTTDGGITLRLTHPRYDHSKVYHVLVRGQVTQDKLETMRNGMRLVEGEQLAPVQIRILRRDPPQTLLEMTLHQGINRQIRRMCRDMNLHVARLIRVQHGPVQVTGLAPGAWRHLSAKEIHDLNTLGRTPGEPS